MELNLVIGRAYVVTTATECTVTDAAGRMLCTATAGQQQAFVASTSIVTVSDDAASVVAVLKGAPALGGGGGSSYTLTAEAVQEVVPLKWGCQPSGSVTSNGLLFGTGHAFTGGVAIGVDARAKEGAVAIGEGATFDGTLTFQYISIGQKAKSKSSFAITLGAQFTETVDGTKVTRTCSTEGIGSITIGAGANTLNTTASDGTVTASSNAVTIGRKASNSAADSVCVGANAHVSAGGGIAIGAGAVCADVGAVVFASYSSDRSYKTQLYFAGAGTPLAVQYYNGEAMIGYIVTDSAGNTVACGTNKLSALFPDNSTTQAATVDADGEWVMPTLFEPNDVKAEPSAQSYTPLPVYPIVEPEIEELTEE